MTSRRTLLRRRVLPEEMAPQTFYEPTAALENASPWRMAWWGAGAKKED